VSTNIIGLSCDNDYIIFIDSCLAEDIVAKLLYKTRQQNILQQFVEMGQI
jgi:hypothetical protein